VFHSQGADAHGDELVSRLRAESYDAIRLPMSRSLVDDTLDDDPDVVIVRYVLGSFDLVRLCHDLRDAIDSRIVVVASGDPSTGEVMDEADDAFVIEVLDAGADDFLSSDTPAPVLAARLRVAMRARPKRERPARRVTVGDLMIDAEAHILVIGGEVVKCPPLQFQLLVTLARRAGSLVSRDTLFRELWGVLPGSVDPRRLRIAISVLRGVLGSGPQRPSIESVSGSGYRLTVPPVVAHDSAEDVSEVHGAAALGDVVRR
jgi:two-component system KDP operon response regulator KdpE